MTVVTLPAWLLRKQANAEAQESRAQTVNVPTPLTQVLDTPPLTDADRTFDQTLGESMEATPLSKAASRREYMRVYMAKRRAKEKAAKA